MFLLLVNSEMCSFMDLCLIVDSANALRNMQFYGPMLVDSANALRNMQFYGSTRYARYRFRLDMQLFAGTCSDS